MKCHRLQYEAEEWLTRPCPFPVEEEKGPASGKPVCKLHLAAERKMAMDDHFEKFWQDEFSVKGGRKPSGRSPA